MTQKKKVVLFIVEGITDEISLGHVLSRLIESDTSRVRFRLTECDITSKFGNSVQDMPKKICEEVNIFMNKYRYTKKDLLEVIHLVDIDGAFIDDSCIIEDCAADKPIYSLTNIYTNKVEMMKIRNRHKTQILNRLIGIGSLYSGTVPYRVYFLSSNLEHVLHDKINQTDEEKLKLANEFEELYDVDSSAFINFLRQFDIGDYQQSWDFIKEGVNSLNRNTNFYIYFNH